VNVVRATLKGLASIHSPAAIAAKRGKKIEDILWGVHLSIASRSVGLLRRVGIEEELTFTGGVTKNVGVIKALEQAIGFKLNISDESHYIGALGAALFALDHILASRAPSSAKETA